MKWLRQLFIPFQRDGLGDDIRRGGAALVKRALYTGAADGGLSISLLGCSISGEPVGDWELSIRRLRPAPVDRSGEAGETRRGSTEGESAVTPKAAGAQTPEIEGQQP